MNTNYVQKNLRCPVITVLIVLKPKKNLIAIERNLLFLDCRKHFFELAYHDNKEVNLSQKQKKSN